MRLRPGRGIPGEPLEGAPHPPSATLEPLFLVGQVVRPLTSVYPIEAKATA
jgi:hypothetical protein